MSLPATWLALPHVGTSGNQGPHTAACTDPQIRILLRRRQFEHRSVRAHDMPHLQCHDLPEFSQATAAPTNAWTPNDRRTRQCPLSSRKTPGPFSTSPYPTPAAAVPTALQSATGPYRVRVWKLTRRLATHNRYFATLPDVLKAVNACFDQWRRPNAVLRRLCCIT